MPRRPLLRTHIFPYHVVNRVNNKEWFHLPLEQSWKILTDECYAISLIGGVQIHSFVMMSNHYHMMLSTPELGLDEVMQSFGCSITRTHNLKSGRSGHLFSGRYRWSVIQSSLYFAHALKYVYRNPVKAGLCNRVEDYRFSTLYGLTGRSFLPVPVDYPSDASFRRFIPEDSVEFLEWLNTPYKSEDSENIKKALRRKIFELPRNRLTREPSHLEFEVA
jgi:REP element-mobilizing transposase RayT